MKFVWRVGLQARWVFKEKLVFCYYYLFFANASCVGRIAAQPSYLNTTAKTECPAWWAEPWTCQCWALDEEGVDWGP